MATTKYKAKTLWLAPDDEEMLEQESKNRKISASELTRQLIRYAFKGTFSGAPKEDKE